MDYNLLNERSRRFAHALLEAFPDWEPYLRLADGEDAKPGTLVVEVPAPPSGVSPMFIDTDCGEITVAFADWHGHYGPLTWDDDEDECTRVALEVVRAIVEERLLSVMALDGEQSRRSWHVAPGEPVETRFGSLTRVRSWRGTYDADLTRS